MKITGALTVAGLVTFMVSSAFAISNFDFEGASNKDLTNTSQPIAYAGTAGSDAGCTTSPCNTCTQTAGSGLFPLACNPARIVPSLASAVLRFTFTTAKAGYPAVTVSDGTERIAAGTTSVGANTSTEISIQWVTLCTNTKVFNTSSTCGADKTSDIRVGIDGNNDGDLIDGEDEYIKVQLKLVGTMCDVVDVDDAVGTNCYTVSDSSTEETGIYSFVVKPGDAKVFLKALTAREGFPTSGTTQFKAIRLYYAQAPDSCMDADEVLTGNCCDSANINQIRNGTPYKETNFVQVGTTFEAETDSFKDLENEKNYVFKVALVDLAGNVGLFTPDGNCMQYSTTPGTYGVHVARPGEVVGLLTDQQNCFVATAAYGSPLAPQVDLFRKFRDEFLLKEQWGRAFVKWYYKTSPSLAKKIGGSETSRLFARGLLWPALGSAWLFLNFGAFGACFVILAGTLTIAILAKRTWQRVSRGPS